MATSREIQLAARPRGMPQPTDFALVEVDVPAERDVLPIVEARALERPIIHSKSGNSHDVKVHVRRGTQAGDVSCVGRYLGFQQCNVQHLTQY